MKYTLVFPYQYKLQLYLTGKFLLLVQHASCLSQYV